MSGYIILNEDRCVGCNKCIAECPVEGANVAYLDKNGQSKIRTNQDACILCGSCVDVCDHGARDYHDDTDDFFEALRNGEQISILAAPSIRYNFDDYRQLFGYFKTKGVKGFYDVSFGADIATWGYMRSAEIDGRDSFISQACPSIVAYIERHRPELIPRLAGTHSPIMCLAVYLKKYRKTPEKLALISPCISKSFEIADTGGLVSYNVTYRKLKEFLLREGATLDACPPKDFDDIECGIGLTFSRPGGLRENIEYHTRNKAWVRQVEGASKAYKYLRDYAKLVSTEKPKPYLVDILNCAEGCNLGTGTCKDISIDDVDAKMNALKQEKLKKKEVVKNGETVYTLFETFDKEFNIDDFRRSYVDKSHHVLKEYSEAQYDEAFNRLYKFDEASRNVNCFSCGYGNCKAFAKALLNGDNHPGNCINYNRAVAKNEHRQVLEQKIKAESAAQAKTDFLSNMSHEIRTPMNAVLGMAQLLMDTSLSSEQRAWTQIINQSGEELLGLINDILDYTKIEGNHLSLENIDFNLCATIAQVTDALFAKMREKNLKLFVSIDESVPHNLIGDPGRFKQILYNLVGNAVKFTEKGHIYIRVLAEQSEAGIKLHVDVEDTGIGIPEKKLGYIFEKFTQGEESTTRRFGGTGLGLAISQKLVHLMGGAISVRSKVGKGSIFSYEICVQKGKEGAVANMPDILLTDKRALVVDDGVLGCKIMGECLCKLRVRTDVCLSGKDALSKIVSAAQAGDPYDFVVLDYRLGETGCLQFCDDLASADSAKEKPLIVLLTAYGHISSLAQFSARGIKGFIIKPFMPAQMEATLKLVLDGKLRNIPSAVVTRHTVTKILHASETVSAPSAIETFEGLKILIAEDLPFNRMLLEKALAKNGCCVDVAVNGVEAVEKAEKGSYDIILMDCQMPEMDGYMATRKIRENEARAKGKHMPIVALTADALTTDRDRCLAAGMDDHLGKPFKQEQIVAIIKKWCRTPER